MNRFHRPRTIAVLALAGALAGAACSEAPPTAADPPAGTNGTNLVPITSQQLSATLGDGLGVVLETRVLDPEGRAIRSAVVQYDVVSGAGLFSADSTLTNDQGYTQVLFLPLSMGMTLIQARTGSDMVTFAIEVAADPDLAATFTKTSGDNQSATVGAILPQPFVVQVRNPDGLPVDSVPVTFTVQFSQGDSAKLAADPSAFATGGRQIVVRTDAAGFARAFLRLGTEAGGHTVSASALVGPAGAQTTETETFTATAQPSARASELVIVSGDNQTVPIDTLSSPESPLNRGREPNPLVVQAVDGFGNPVQGVAVQWRVSDGGGTMFSFTTFSDPLGFATNVYTGVTEGPNAIVAIAAGTAPVQFDIEGVVIADPEDDGGDGDGDGG